MFTWAMHPLAVRCLRIATKPRSPFINETRERVRCCTNAGAARAVATFWAVVRGGTRRAAMQPVRSLHAPDPSPENVETSVNRTRSGEETRDGEHG